MQGCLRAGLHPACIKHDACYDTCNRVHGCKTFAAAYCRHGGYHFTNNPIHRMLENDLGFAFCDWTTTAEENSLNVAGWVRGFGPQLYSQVYEYTDKNFSMQLDLSTCPAGKHVEEKTDPENLGDKPQNPIGKSPYDPIDPCLLVPPGGTVLNQTLTSCSLSYGSSAPVMRVSVHVYAERPDVEWSCQTLPTRSGAYVEEELTVGECGYRLRYDGVPSSWELTKPFAWGISFLLDRFEVEVITEGYLDANVDWVYSTASFIEDQITDYLTQVGNKLPYNPDFPLR